MQNEHSLTCQDVPAQIQHRQELQAGQRHPIEHARVNPEQSATQLNLFCPPPTVKRYPVKVAQADPGPAGSVEPSQYFSFRLVDRRLATKVFLSVAVLLLPVERGSPPILAF
ncbi:unnamed protein product [Ectocarpus sp. 12 AP-2014]